MVEAGMSPIRARTPLPAVFASLVLALFLSWLGTALVHAHPTDPTCQFCKVVHNAPADLVRRSSVPEPLRATERMAAPATSQPHHPDIAAPQGRAPPVA
jgi:hypothetical protein